MSCSRLAFTDNREGGVDKVMMPDLSSKASAQKSIGLDMETLIMEKKEFKKQILPSWDKEVI